MQTLIKFTVTTPSGHTGTAKLWVDSESNEEREGRAFAQALADAGYTVPEELHLRPPPQARQIRVRPDTPEPNGGPER